MSGPRETLADAVSTYIRETSGQVVTDWVMIAATTTLEDIGTGATSYWCEGNVGQPIHVSAGLLRYGLEQVIWDNNDDDEE